MTTTLLPCPFCGSDRVDITNDPNTDVDFYYISCTDCEAEGQRITTGQKRKNFGICGEHMMTT